MKCKMVHYCCIAVMQLMTDEPFLKVKKKKKYALHEKKTQIYHYKLYCNCARPILLLLARLLSKSLRGFDQFNYLLLQEIFFL